MGTNTTSSYLDPPQLHGVQNKDGTYTLSALEMKKQSDFNYYVAKMLQGGLNLANLNKDTNQVFTDIEGNVATVTETAAGLTVSVSSLSGDVSTISATVNGLSVADETGSYTIIDGDKIISKDHATNKIVQVENGSVLFKQGTATVGSITPTSVGMDIEASAGQWVYIWGNTQLGLTGQTYINGQDIAATANSTIELHSYGTIKLLAGTNMAIDSSGTIYIGASYGQSGNVTIGQTGGRVDLNGTIYKNGVLL